MNNSQDSQVGFQPMAKDENHAIPGANIKYTFYININCINGIHNIIQ